MSCNSNWELVGSYWASNAYRLTVLQTLFLIAQFPLNEEIGLEKTSGRDSKESARDPKRTSGYIRKKINGKTSEQIHGEVMSHGR